MRYLSTFLLLIVSLVSFGQVYQFDNPTARTGDYQCQTSLDFNLINGNILAPYNENEYHWAITHVDYDGVLEEYVEIIVEEAIEMYKELPEFECVEFIRVEDGSKAHFDFRVGQNIGDKAPEPPEQFGNYTLAYTWGVYQWPQPYFNQVWINYDNVAMLGSDVIVIAHEMGHRFNIAHSQEFWAVMYYAMHNQSEWNQDDFDAFKARYSFLADNCPDIEEPQGPAIPTDCDTIYQTDTLYVSEHPMDDALVTYSAYSEYKEWQQGNEGGPIEFLDSKGIRVLPYRAFFFSEFTFKSRAYMNGSYHFRSDPHTTRHSANMETIAMAFDYLSAENLSVKEQGFSFRLFFLIGFIFLIVLIVIWRAIMKIIEREQ